MLAGTPLPEQVSSVFDSQWLMLHDVAKIFQEERIKLSDLHGKGKRWTNASGLISRERLRLRNL